MTSSLPSLSKRKLLEPTSRTHGLQPERFQSSRDYRFQRSVLWVSVGGLLVFLLWASISNLEEISRSQGSVIALSRTQVIQSIDGGVIEEILVHEGDIIEKDEVLFRLDQGRQQAAYTESLGRAAGLSAAVARLRAEVFGGEPRFDERYKDFPAFRQNQLQLLQKRRQSLEQDLSGYRRQAVLIEKELGMLEPLLAKGDVSMTEVIRLQRQQADIQSQERTRQSRYFQEVQGDLTRAEEELASVEQVLSTRSQQLRDSTVRAPVRGIVKNIRLSTKGAVVRGGEEVLQLVPLDDELIVESKLKSRDIAFVKVGQRAVVKVDSYDARIFGGFTGEVIFLSPDTLTEQKPGELPMYRMQVKVIGRQFDQAMKHEVALQPGMSATVEVVTGEKSVLDFLMKPIMKTVSESMSER